MTVLVTIFVLLIAVYLSGAGLFSTLSRYIKREQDEIVAYYTSLYFDTDGQSKSVAVEAGVGYVEFNLMNYIADNVTQRDIEYTIRRPEKFYDINGNQIADPSTAEKLYVLDVWGTPKEVSKSTYLYRVEVVKNTGEVVDKENSKYKFTYEKLGTSAVGKTHHVNLKLTRESGELYGDEDISIVVQLEKPYREVFIINMSASSRIITFSTAETQKFDITFDELHVQTADIFAFYKNGTQRQSAEYGDKKKDDFTSKAIKLTIDWSGFIFDETDLNHFQMGMGGKEDDSGSGSVINGDETYIDITKSVISSIDATGSSGKLVMFVPQQSDFSLFFLQMSDTATITVKIEIYVNVGGTGTYSYVPYNDTYFGFANGQYVVSATSAND